MSDSHEALVLLGGAGGVGGEIVRTYARTHPEAPVWITYATDAESAEALCADVPQATAIQCDVTDTDSLAALAQAIGHAGHRVDSIVHGAVAAVRTTLVGAADDLLRAVDVSAVSLVRAVTAVDDLLVDGASIVYLTSKGSTRVVPKYGLVGVGKAAAESIVRYLAFELGPRGIRVNALGFGPMDTKAFTVMVGPNITSDKVVAAAAKNSPLQPPADMASVADAVVFLLGDGARGMTAQVLDVDGGLLLKM
ncbi:MAG: SDR family oxidoreductase [Aeromicrobium sp.]